VLETEAYKARPRDALWIADSLGIAPALVGRGLEKLAAVGVIRAHGSGYELTGSLTVDTRAIPQLKAHWCEVARGRLSSPSPEDVFSYNVLSASRADIARIRQLLIATYREIRTIVEHTERDEAVALVNLQVVNWSPS
jgi:hypothetical protein